MYRRLGAGLALGLLRVAGRRGRSRSARLLPGPAGGRAPVAVVPPCREAPRGLGPGLLPLLAALAWSSRPAPAEQERERQGAGGAAAGDAEAEIIQLLKRAKLCIMKDEPAEAELILHDALRLAYKSDNKKAITYTYDLMANLAFIRGQLENAEKLFKATMSHLLGGGMQQEDNAIIEISLKLATIYAAQNRQELALAGYEFCISTLEEKIEREKELSEDTLSVSTRYERGSEAHVLPVCAHCGGKSMKNRAGRRMGWAGRSLALSHLGPSLPPSLPPSVSLIYNVVLISAVQQSDSVVHI
ncbi:tetratricopeptide repeat protein 19, mitochondrial isoform 5-T5 [Megaptera novaeangliae]